MVPCCTVVLTDTAMCLASWQHDFARCGDSSSHTCQVNGVRIGDSSLVLIGVPRREVHVAEVGAVVMASGVSPEALVDSTGYVFIPHTASWQTEVSVAPSRNWSCIHK